MLPLDSGQLAALLPPLFWPLLRILALISTAPLFSEKSILAPIKLGLGILIALLIAAVRMAGEVIGLQMGLSFATFFDPASGLNTPLLARVLNLLALLVFISLNGHLWLLSLLAPSWEKMMGEVFDLLSEILSGMAR